MSLLCLSMCLIHTKFPSSTTPHPPRHPCLLFPILIFHTRSVMCSNHIAAIRESSQDDCLAGIFLFAFFRYACAISAYSEKKNLQVIVLFCFLQHNKLGLNRVEGDRVTQQLVSTHPLQHAEKYSAFFYASLHKLFRLLVMTSSFSCTIFSDVVCSLFRMVARNLYAARACRLYLFNLRD